MLSSPDIRLESFSPTAKNFVASGLCKFVACCCLHRPERRKPPSHSF